MRLTVLVPTVILLLSSPADAAAPASAPVSPSTESLQLAHRLLVDQGGFELGQTMLSGFDHTVAKAKGVAHVAERRAALQTAIAENEAGLYGLQDGLVKIYAEILTDEEMSGWIAFLETLDGRAIVQKKLGAAPFGHPDLTPAETVALKRFNDSPVAQTIAKKNGILLGETIKLENPMFARLYARANVLYCQHVEDCQAAPKPAGS